MSCVLVPRYFSMPAMHGERKAVSMLAADPARTCVPFLRNQRVYPAAVRANAQEESCLHDLCVFSTRSAESVTVNKA